MIAQLRSFRTSTIAACTVTSEWGERALVRSVQRSEGQVLAVLCGREAKATKGCDVRLEIGARINAFESARASVLSIRRRAAIEFG